ncbi:chemotaxis protein CheY [mine drainage metagenome]|uniref:Chemotaxis protein CheY n=1 Tax=mine drainage metagenome TaxID=410659 RepID=A0A1J5PRR7_9ZZZZ
MDALQILQNTLPDLMLLDIEMPRMDGFELTKVMRADHRLAHIPIIMITSRTADKHREHAMNLGVNAYLGKPFQEDVVLAKIVELTDKTYAT